MLTVFAMSTLPAPVLFHLCPSSSVSSRPSSRFRSCSISRYRSCTSSSSARIMACTCDSASACHQRVSGDGRVGVQQRLRREALLGLATVLAAAGIPLAASEAGTVRLRDVESQGLQEALRAAVAGDFAYADQLFTRLLVQEPESASLWSNRGSVRLSLQRYQDAADDFSTAVRLAPQAPVPLLNRAIAYEALGRYQDAISDCKLAIASDPKEYAAWFNLGNVQVRVKDYDSALTSYAKASALAPGIAGYRLKQAMVLFELDRREESKKLVQGLVRKYPNYGEARAALAAVLWTEGQRSRAEEEFLQTQEPRYNDIRWLSTEMQWLPSMVRAMSDFLTIQ